MPIRPATYSDIVPAAQCLARAFKDEHLFGEHMHPYQAKYPHDMYLHFLPELRTIYASGPDHRLLVSYRLLPDGTEHITGLAHWTRFRKEPAPESYYTRLAKWQVSCYNYISSYFYPNRAAEPSRSDILSQLPQFCGSFWSGSRAEVWDLTLLGVEPAAGGQGHGRELAEYGFELARKEGVGCSVISSDGKEGFYQKCGFDCIVGTARDHGGNDNPLNLHDIRGGTILFWDNGREL